MTLNDIVQEMSEEKKECLYFLVGYALESEYKQRETIIKHCNSKILPKCHRKVCDILREMRDSEDLAIIFLIDKALKVKEQLNEHKV